MLCMPPLPSRRCLAVTAVAGLAALSLLTAPLPVLAGALNDEVDQMFNDLGAMGNYTQPGAFRGQTYGTYIGGNIYYRTPNKTYQLTAIQWPSARGGCGGIDLFGGSFSHISAAEFKNMLKNITAALPGVAFQLALGSVSPLLKSIASEMKAFETWINNARINSCETATALVSSAAEASGYDSQRACAKIAQLTGLEPDIDAAMRRCASNAPNVLANARSGGNAEAAALAPFVGNFTWKALKSVNTLDDRAREVVMSITGALIFPPESANHDPQYVAPSISSVAHLLYGQSDAGNGKIKVQLLRCNNYSDCDVVTRDNDYVHEPLTKKVADMMHSLADHIRNRTPIPNNSALVGFVNTTSLPVWRMMSVGTSIPGSRLADTMIANYKEVVAADYAFVFLRQFAEVGVAALTKQYELRDAQRTLASRQREDAQRLMTALQQEQQVLFGKVRSVSLVIDDLERYERALRSGLSSHVMNMLGFAARLPR